MLINIYDNLKYEKNFLHDIIVAGILVFHIEILLLHFLHPFN